MTTSYVAGTVSVSAGERTVTGEGTGWLTANIAPGFFALQDSVGPVIPVERIVSDTELLLYVDWPGETVSGAGYWLSYDTRDGQQTVNNAVRLSEYIARLDSDSLSALAGLNPEADKIPYFNSESTAVLADFPEAARALLAGTGVVSNSQLPTRLRTLVTPVADLNTINETGWSGAFDTSTNVPIAGFYLVHTEVWVDGAYAVQFAYSLFNTEVAFRRHKVNGVWQPWRAAGQVAVGTVSQSSGLPLGAIIERGGNANGEYVRFADGTQICWSLPPGRLLTGVATNRLYGTAIFPVSFAGAVSVSATINLNTLADAGLDVNSPSSVYSASVADVSNSSCVISLTSPQTGISGAVNLARSHYIATGRWF